MAKISTSTKSNKPRFKVGDMLVLNENQFGLDLVGFTKNKLYRVDEVLVRPPAKINAYVIVSEKGSSAIACHLIHSAMHVFREKPDHTVNLFDLY